VVEVVLTAGVGRNNVRASLIFRLAELAFNVFDNQTVFIPRVYGASESIFYSRWIRRLLGESERVCVYKGGKEPTSQESEFCLRSCFSSCSPLFDRNNE
jgi:hypothetical protein